MDVENNTFPSLCAKGCGFYGTTENNNLCSKCYEDLLKEEAIMNSASPRPVCVTAPPFPSLEETESSTGPRVKTRCKSCNKKVGLTGFNCKCGDLFCAMHRYPEEHSCSFDYKMANRLILAKNNSVVKADKLSRRI